MAKPELAMNMRAASEPAGLEVEADADPVERSPADPHAEPAATSAPHGPPSEEVAGPVGGETPAETGLDEALLEAFGAEDSDTFFRWLLARVRQAIELAPHDRGLREVARSLQRFAREGATENQAFDELSESFSAQGIELALPVLATLAARALVEPRRRRGAAALSTSLAQQAVASALRSARRLMDADALESLFGVASRVGRQAQVRNISVRALPQALERAVLQRLGRVEAAGSHLADVGGASGVAKAARGPSRAERSQPNPVRTDADGDESDHQVPATQQPAPGSSGRERTVMSRLVLTGPIEIVIYQR